MARESEQQVLTLTTSGGGTTIGRMSEIERGRGNPPTEAELRDLAAFKRHPVVRQMQAGRKKAVAGGSIVSTQTSSAPSGRTSFRLFRSPTGAIRVGRRPDLILSLLVNFVIAIARFG